MKKSVLALSPLSALILSAGVAQAADALTAELKVVGELAVPTCTVAATDDGIYNIGKPSATLIKPSATTALTTMTKIWTITCDADTYLNFTPIDNRVDSKSAVNAPDAFGLGYVNGTGKIGYFNIGVSNAKVDSAATQLFRSSSTSSFIPKASVSLYLEDKIGWTTTANTQKSGKVFVADIAVTPTLVSSATMNGPITENTNIDGSVTLTFAYGI